MSRTRKLLKMSSHPMLHKLFKKLTQEETDAVTRFVLESERLDDDNYMHKANRWYLDEPKPKHYSDMWAIVTQCK